MSLYKKTQNKTLTHSPTRTEVPELFINDPGIKALLHELLQERIRTRHINTDICHVQVHSFKSLQEDSILIRSTFKATVTQNGQQAMLIPVSAGPQ